MGIGGKSMLEIPNKYSGNAVESLLTKKFNRL
jgi:hypothetical protein